MRYKSNWFLSLIALVSLVTQSSAQKIIGIDTTSGLAPSYQWGHSFQNKTNDINAQGYSISASTVDASGAMWNFGSIVSWFEDINPGLGIYEVGLKLNGIGTNGDNRYNFFQKLDENGNFLLGGQFGNDKGIFFSATRTLHVLTAEHDLNNSIYFAGETQIGGTGTYDMDPNRGEEDTTTVFLGSKEVFVNKIDANGNLLWSTGLGLKNLTSMNIDNQGNVYISGTFNTVDLESDAVYEDSILYNRDSVEKYLGETIIIYRRITVDGESVFTPLDSADIVEFYGSEDNLIKGLLGHDSLYIRYFGQGPAKIDSLDFDPGPGTTYLKSKGANDAYLVKLNTNGVFQWAITIGGTSGLIRVDGEWETLGIMDNIADVAVDEIGDILLTGYITTIDENEARKPLPKASPVDLDPSPAPGDTFYAYTNASFILKLDNQARFKWAKLISSEDGLSIPSARDLYVDENNAIYVSGNFNSPTDFDPGAGVQLKETDDGSNYLLKLTAEGDFEWVKTFGGRVSSSARGNEGNFYFSGRHFSGTAVDYAPGPKQHLLVGATADSVRKIGTFVSSLDTNGDFRWVAGLESNSGNSAITGFSLDIHENLYLYGITTRPAFGTDTEFVDLLPGVGGDQLLPFFNNTGTPGYAFKWGQQRLDTFSVVACNRYTTPRGLPIDTSGFYVNTDTVENRFGEDSILSTFDMIVYPATYDTLDKISTCDKYTVPETLEEFRQSGIFEYIIPNAVGCDSLITVELEISNTYSSTFVSVCGSYTSPSGRHVWNTSGQYRDTLVNKNGCDSIIGIQLNVVSIDTSVTVNDQEEGRIVVSNEFEGTYQWLDCNNNKVPIAGATEQHFTISKNANSALVIAKQGCVDTVDCMNTNKVGIRESLGVFFNVFPNPVKDQLYIQTHVPIINLQLTDLSGRIIQQIKPNKAFNQSIDLYELNAGPYVLSIQTERVTKHYPIIKE